MCFEWSGGLETANWTDWEHLVRAFGPIFAPWVTGCLGNGHAGPSGRFYSPRGMHPRVPSHEMIALGLRHSVRCVCWIE
jgi:hypothetical protein